MLVERKTHPYLSLANSYLIDSPQPTSISYWYNVGSLLGLCLIIQICSGLFLAMHYCSDISLAFDSVEHIMRDVNYGWLIRYLHANGASFFFTCLYLHIGKAIYYGSYRKPRTLVWVIGVIIFIATMATGFLGYLIFLNNFNSLIFNYYYYYLNSYFLYFSSLPFFLYSFSHYSYLPFNYLIHYIHYIFNINDNNYNYNSNNNNNNNNSNYNIFHL